MADQEVIKYLLKLEDKMSAQLALTTRRADALEDSLEDLKKTQNATGKSSKMLGVAAKGSAMALAAAAAGATATAIAYTKMGREAIKTGANLEAFETRIGVLLGSLDKGKRRVEELFAISSRTPFSINGLVEAEATLEAFGVNAEVVRDGVMDLAGATGIDLVTAAKAVGKAMAGGAGAADVLREKGVIAMVEVQAGMKAAQMTTAEFRQALLETLETNEKLAGGTASMATTFEGLMSTLKDQFTVFAKMVADSKLFEAAKLVLEDILGVLDENKETTEGLADVVGNQLTNALLAVMEHFGFMLSLTARIAKAFNIGETILIGWAGMTNRLADSWRKVTLGILEAGRAMKSGIGLSTEMHDQSIARLKAERKENFQGYKVIALRSDELKAQAAALDATIAKYSNASLAVDNIRLELARLDNTGVTVKLQQVDADGNPIKSGTGSTPIMSGKQLAPAAKKGTTSKAAKDAENFAKAMDKLRKQFAGTAAKIQPQLTGSKLLEQQMMRMLEQFAEAKQAAEALGPSAVAAFQEVEAGMLASINAIATAIPAERRKETAQKIGSAMGGASDFLQSGGLSALGAAGPMGAGAASLIGFGQQGDAAYDAEVSEKASELAENRQKDLQAQRDKLLEAGFSEQELEARGLGQEQIKEAGEVTKADKKAAAEDTDRGEVMADMVTQAVNGVIDGIKSLLQGLPDILSELIPLFLVELPSAIIEMLPDLIEELIPVLLFEMPKALFQMLVKLIPRLVKMIFVDLPGALFRGISQWWQKVWKSIQDMFSLSFQTGGYVPRTGMALVHQGERIIPSNGAGTGTATARGLQAFTGSGKSSITINTAVVDPDSIPTLGRLLERDLGAHGREENDLFGRPSPFTTL